jgi:hypothetical protein
MKLLGLIPHVSFLSPLLDSLNGICYVQLFFLSKKMPAKAWRKRHRVFIDERHVTFM